MSDRLTVASRGTPQSGSLVHTVMETVGDIAYDSVSAESVEAVVLQGGADIAVLNAGDTPALLPEELILAALMPGPPFLQDTIAVLCRADRPDMRGLFYLPDIRNKYGKVWLIGAGPGSADLLTFRAWRALKKVDVVYYDDLVDESILSLCSGECVYVGKRKGRPSHSQEFINKELYRSAVEGKTVGRLKGGDPSIFGRAGEELAFLRRRGISVETVPGITAASAAAAAGLISLTQRQVSKSVVFLSGHGMETGTRKMPARETRVYYMAASKLVEISRELMEEGISPCTPVAIVRNAGAWDESIVASTIEEMTALVAQAPALLIVGQITKGAYVEKKALFTGLDPDCVQVKEPVVHQPLVMPAPELNRMSGNRGNILWKTADPKPQPLDLNYFSAIIFDSPETVEAFEDIYGALPKHLLCYITDDKIRPDLQRRSVHPWRIVMCPVRKNGWSPIE